MPLSRWYRFLTERLNANRGPWARRAFLGAIVLAAAVYFFRDAMFGTPVETVSAERGDIVQTVVASGRVMTPQRVSVGAVVTERVVGIPVQEGQSVKRGDTLVVLDDSDERAAIAQAQAAVAQAEALSLIHI